MIVRGYTDTPPIIYSHFSSCHDLPICACHLCEGGNFSRRGIDHIFSVHCFQNLFAVAGKKARTQNIFFLCFPFSVSKEKEEEKDKEEEEEEEKDMLCVCFRAFILSF